MLWGKYSFDQLRLFKLQAEEASHYNVNVSRATFKRFIVSIFFAKLSTIIYLTNETMIPKSGIRRRRQSKNVHRFPFFLFRPHIALFFFSPHTPLWSLFTGYPFLSILIAFTTYRLQTLIVKGRMQINSSSKDSTSVRRTPANVVCFFPYFAPTAE